MPRDEYKERCDECGNTGSQTFARIFFEKIDGMWKHLCKKCWELKT